VEYLMLDRTRLIEVAFPVKQAARDAVHEKNVRRGHISTLHIWPEQSVSDQVSFGKLISRPAAFGPTEDEKGEV
jgi:hypothetical protein